MCSDKEILDTRFSFLLTYYDEKKQKREWEMIQNHQAQMALTILYCKSRNDQKENQGLLEEEEWTSCFSCWKGREETLHTHVCGRFDFFPPCGRCICCCLVTRKVPGTALVAEPTTRAVTSHGVDATVSFCIVLFFFYHFCYMQLTFNTMHFEVKRRKQGEEYCKFWIVALTLLCIRDFHSLWLPEESSTFPEVVLGSRSSDFDSKGI